MPDSFARAGRPETCNVWTHERLPGAPGEAVYRMRQEEIRNAVERVRELPWVDPDNLFLMGHDEGGDAVAEYPGGGFRARVISGSFCARGVRAPAGTPILSLASAEDPWLAANPPDSCARKAGRRSPPVVSKVLPGYLHDLSGAPDGRRAVIQFIQRHTLARR